MRKILIILAVTIPVVALLCAAWVIVFLLTADLRSAAEKYASAALDRKVTIGSLTVKWGDPLFITIKDFHLANASWGTEPEMGSFDDLQASLTLRPLLRGKAIFEKLSVTNPHIFLERDADGVGNWRFRKKTTANTEPDAFYTYAKDRTHFPVILDSGITGGLFRMKTSGGSTLRLDANTFSIIAADQAQTVTFKIDGAYNKVPAIIDIKGDSFDTLRNKREPYGMDIRIDTKSDHLHFKGTMTDPVNMDGAKGSLIINASVLREIAPMFGVTMNLNMGAKIEGDLTRNRDEWILENIKGHLAGNELTGTFALHEGSRAEPDAVKTTLSFTRVDINKVINGFVHGGNTKSSDFARIPLKPDAKPGIVADAHITAREMFYEPYHVTDVDMHIRSEPSKITLDALEFTIIGGRAHLKAVLDGTGKIPYWRSEAKLQNGEISKSVRLKGKYSGLISGKFDALSTLELHGQTVESGLRDSAGGVVVVMNKGQIARSLLEKASMDIRALLRTKEGSVPITCLIGIYNLHGGTGDVLPLRLRTTETVLNGGGVIDLINAQVDVTMRSKPSTSSKYALDWPLRFKGGFDGIDLLPAPGIGTEILEQPIASLMPKNLDPKLRALANESECLK